MITALQISGSQQRNIFHTTQLIGVDISNYKYDFTRLLNLLIKLYY